MPDQNAKNTVLIIITLDTKSEEAKYLKEWIMEDPFLRSR
jgi:hypothetical protein